MSSPKAAAAKTTRAPKPGAKPAAAKAADPKPRIISAPKPKTPPPTTGMAGDAVRLAAEIERATADGRLDALPPEAMQPLMAALCKIYAAQVEEGSKATPVEEGQIVSPTAIMLTSSGLLRAANLAVFELGMWQSWTGR